MYQCCVGLYFRGEMPASLTLKKDNTLLVIQKSDVLILERYFRGCPGVLQTLMTLLAFGNKIRKTLRLHPKSEDSFNVENFTIDYESPTERW